MIRQTTSNTQTPAPTATRIHALPSGQLRRDSKIITGPHSLVRPKATQVTPSFVNSQIQSFSAPTQPLSSREILQVRLNQSDFDVHALNTTVAMNSGLISGTSGNEEESNPHELRIDVTVVADRPVLAHPITPPIRRQNLTDEGSCVILPSVLGSAALIGSYMAVANQSEALPTLFVKTSVGALIGGFAGAGVGLIMDSKREADAQAIQGLQVITDLEAGES
jgi:hypothetical protein